MMKLSKEEEDELLKELSEPFVVIRPHQLSQLPLIPFNQVSKKDQDSIEDALIPLGPPRKKQKTVENELTDLMISAKPLDNEDLQLQNTIIQKEDNKIKVLNNTFIKDPKTFNQAIQFNSEQVSPYVLLPSLLQIPPEMHAKHSLSDVRTLITQDVPFHALESRVGPGNRTLYYVTDHYLTNKANEIFVCVVFHM